MARQHIWRSLGTIPRDGSPILLLLSDYVVYSCRFGVPEGSVNNDDCSWYDIDWSGTAIGDDAESRAKFMGWLPFPLIADPHPFSEE